MPTWGEILEELKQIPPQPGPAGPFDLIRRKYLSSLHAATKRNTIVYATKWTQSGPVDADDISITPEDVQGFMEVIHGLKGDNLDLILHSPGGSPEAAEALVSYLRAKFKDIRVLIPQAAMSAATMLTCSANRVVMGAHSFIGPIDPQLVVNTELGRRAVAIHAILEQFELAKKECANPALLPVWLPTLRQYGPELIVKCRLGQALAVELASRWLELYMLQGDPNAKTKAEKIASELSEHGKYKSHGRFINRETAKSLGFVVEDLEADQQLQDALLSVFHSVTLTFTATPATKIIENQNGRAFIKLAGPRGPVQPMGPVPMPFPFPIPMPPMAPMQAPIQPPQPGVAPAAPSSRPTVAGRLADFFRGFRRK